MGATADCELISSGFWGQPVNTITTLGLVLAGLYVLRLPRLRWVGAALIGTGAGSFLFHGPMPAGSQWAHDVSLVWLLLVVAGLGIVWEPWTRLPGLLALGGLLAMLPMVADALAVVLVVVAGLLHARKDLYLTSYALVGVGAFAVFGRLGATGGPLCNPGSALQPHGLWHLGSAAVVTWWVMRMEVTGSIG